MSPPIDGEGRAMSPPIDGEGLRLIRLDQVPGEHRARSD